CVILVVASGAQESGTENSRMAARGAAHSQRAMPRLYFPQFALRAHRCNSGDARLVRSGQPKKKESLYLSYAPSKGQRSNITAAGLPSDDVHPLHLLRVVESMTKKLRSLTSRANCSMSVHR